MFENKTRHLIKAFWKLFKDYWRSEEKWSALVLLIVVSVMNIEMAAVLSELADYLKALTDILLCRDLENFYFNMRIFLILVVIFTLIATYMVYFMKILQIKWRTWMTNHYVETWLNNQAYYRMQISESRADNPDQRISEDIAGFVELTISLLTAFILNLATLIVFIEKLWSMSDAWTVPFFNLKIPGDMVCFCLIYAALGSFLTHIIGRKLIPLNFAQQRYEADFRFSMMRVRENAENIAFYRGEAVEKKNFRERFNNVISNYWKLIKRNKLLGFYTNGYMQMASVAPTLIVAPKYLADEKMQYGDLTLITFAFAAVLGALNYFIEAYGELASLAAIVRRLSELTDNMEKAVSIKSSVKQIKSNKEIFSAENLQVTLPNGQTLLKNIGIELEPGTRLLITGKSGCGKSTLLRTLSGIWPFGNGKIFSSETGKLFLSQRPYLPLGTLRQAIYYPLEEVTDSDEEIKEVMRLADLEKFIDKLDAEDDWSKILSPGEQQRIAFARILLLKPRWIFLDESTSALDETQEKIMYELIKKNLPRAGIVSVGHRSSLFALHDKELRLSNDLSECGI